MKNIYKESLERVYNGSKFAVDFKKRTLKVDGKNVDLEGADAMPRMPLGEVLSKIEEFYLAYKHSIPSERSNSKRHVYFKALKETDLDDDDMMYGEGRDYAQIRLELFILLEILSYNLVWDEELMGKWFWQSKADKDLVLLREWID